jgi:hypothetical protein
MSRYPAIGIGGAFISPEEASNEVAIQGANSFGERDKRWPQETRRADSAGQCTRPSLMVTFFRL